MKALSPVSADLIGRLRKILDDSGAPAEGRALYLLTIAEKATPEKAKDISEEIITFLKARKLWKTIS